MSPYPHEQLLVGMANFYQDLQRQIGRFGLRMAGERFDGCRQYQLLVGNRVLGKGAKNACRSLLGLHPVVPQGAIEWSRILGLEVDFHRPRSNCPHSIGATVAVQSGSAYYNPNTGKVALKRGFVMHAISSQNGLRYVVDTRNNSEEYWAQQPGMRLDNSINKEQTTHELSTVISDVGDGPALSFAHATGQLITNTVKALGPMQREELLNSVAARFRLPTPEI